MALNLIQQKYSSIIRNEPRHHGSQGGSDWWYNSVKARGEPNFSPAIVGGKISRDGNNVVVQLANPKPQIALPFKTTIYPVSDLLSENTSATVTAEMEDAIAFMFWCDVDEKILKQLHAGIENANGNKPQMSVDEKREQTTKLDAEMLLARRNLEAATRRAEALGKPVKRRPDTPWEVLLWCGLCELAANSGQPKRKLLPTTSKATK